MLHAKKQPYNSVWLWADSQKELGETFIRFQEFYESPSKQFKNKTFTMGAIKSWYSSEYGSDMYSDYWVGFNIPSVVLEPFRSGLFDPLTTMEQNLLDIFKYRHDKFYIIGAQNNSVLRHELSHALYGYSEKYKTEINSYIQKHNTKFKKIQTYILKKGYCKEVLNDEIQAYITDNEDEFIQNNLDSNIISDILSIYKRHRKHDKKLG